MDRQHKTPPVGDTLSLGFADFSVFVNSDGAVVASGFGSLAEIAAGRPYSPGLLPHIVRDALESWKDGDFEPLMDIPVVMTATPKITRLRSELRKVPAGQVVTYSELAERAGLAGLPRLAGRACSENPCLLFVPCHRVVAATNIGPPVIPGSYAGTGAVKAQLLTHEGVAVKGDPPRDDASGF